MQMPKSREKPLIKTIFAQRSSEKSDPYDTASKKYQSDLQYCLTQREAPQSNYGDTSNFKKDTNIEPAEEVRSLFNEMKKKYVLQEDATQSSHNKQNKNTGMFIRDQYTPPSSQRALNSAANYHSENGRSVKTEAVKPIKSFQSNFDDSTAKKTGSTTNKSLRGLSYLSQDQSITEEKESLAKNYRSNPVSHRTPQISENNDLIFSFRYQIQNTTAANKKDIHTPDHAVRTQSQNRDVSVELSPKLVNSQYNTEKSSEERSRKAKYDRVKIDQIIDRILKNQKETQAGPAQDNTHAQVNEPVDPINTTAKRIKMPSIFSASSYLKTSDHITDDVYSLDNYNQGQQKAPNRSQSLNKDLGYPSKDTNEETKLKNFFSSYAQEIPTEMKKPLHIDGKSNFSSEISVSSVKREKARQRNTNEAITVDNIKNSGKETLRQNTVHENANQNNKPSTKKAEEGYHFLEADNRIRNPPLNESIADVAYKIGYSRMRHNEEEAASHDFNNSKESSFSFDFPTQKQQVIPPSELKSKEMIKFPKTQDIVYGQKFFVNVPNRGNLDNKQNALQEATGIEDYLLNDVKGYMPQKSDMVQQDVTAFWKPEEEQHLSLEFQQALDKSDTYALTLEDNYNYEAQQKRNDQIQFHETGQRILKSHQKYIMSRKQESLNNQPKPTFEHPQIKEKRKEVIYETKKLNYEQNLEKLNGYTEGKARSSDTGKKIMTGKELKDELYGVADENELNEEILSNILNNRKGSSPYMSKNPYQSGNASPNKETSLVGSKQQANGTQNSSAYMPIRGLKTEMPLYLNANRTLH